MNKKKYLIKDVGADFGDAPFGSSLKSKDYTSEGIPVIQGQNIVDQVFDWNRKLYTSVEKFNSLKRSQCNAGDLVFPKIGNRTVGSCAIAPVIEGYSTYLLSTNMMKMSVKPEIADIKYVYYYFCQSSIRQTIISQAGGGAQPIFNFTSLKNFEIELPPLPIQRKIAAVLSAYDDLIEVNTRRIRVLEEMAQAVYREWFGSVDAGSLPEGWKVVKLGDLAKVNSESIKKGNEPEEINYVDISSVSTGRIDNVERIIFSDAPSRARRIVQHGDIIWSSVRPNRKSYSVIINPVKDMIVSTGFAVLRAEKVPFTYLYQAVTTDEFVDYLINHATGAAYPAVNAGDFENAEILLPPKDLFQKFDDLINPMLLLQNSLLEKNANLRRTRDLLLPRLVSGEVAVSEVIVEGG